MIVSARFGFARKLLKTTMPVVMSLIAAHAASAQPVPGLRISVVGTALPASADARPGCDAIDKSDTSARAIRLASGEVQLYASHFLTRIESGPDLLHLRHRCPVVMRGAESDDPAAYDDRAWIGSLWTADGRVIWALVHNEFQGDRRPVLCPSRRYMDCWFNAVTAAISRDGGRSFQRAPGRALVAALPYRYEQVGRGHHGYFGPSNIVSLSGAQYAMVFATRTGAQRPGNCLLRTTNVGDPASWRGWDGAGFGITFADPYRQEVRPEEHVCAPVGQGALPWPVTSLVRHEASGLFVALMLNGARDGGVFYATSPDLLSWSKPDVLMPAVGLGAWQCADPAPIAYPSLLDPASPDPNFTTVGAQALLFATRFNPRDCRAGLDRDLVRWAVSVQPR